MHYAQRGVTPDPGSSIIPLARPDVETYKSRMNDSEIRLEIATRAAGIGIWDWDLLTNAMIYSPAARAICGFDPDQSIDLDDVRAVTHPEDHPHTWAMAARALDPAIREQAVYEYRIVRPDGAVREVVAHGEAIFADIEGVERAVRYIGTLQDITERKRLEEAERTATDRLRLALDAGRMAVWEFDVASERVTGSAELYRLLGFPEDARPTLEQLRAGFAPKDVGCVARAAQAAWPKGDRFIEVEFQYRRFDGPWRWYLLRAEIKLDSEGRPQTLLGVLADITERKSAEDRLRDSEARFRGMADSAPAPVWITGVAGGIEFVNEAFVEITGMPADALLGDVWIQLLHTEDLAHVAKARMAARETLSSYSFEARFRRADGEHRWMFVSAKPRFDQSGNFLGYVGLAIDLTETHRAQDALRESEERFRLIAETAPVMLWMSDAKGACTYINPALRTFWGASEDLSEFTWSDTLFAEDRPALLKALARSLDRQEAFEGDARYYRADGEIRDVRTVAQPRLDASGRFIGMIGVNIDLTDLRAAEIRQRLLINELNHRVKNTLASVQSIARQTLREDESAGAARERLLDRIMAMSVAHDILTRESWEGASVHDIVSGAIRPFVSPDASRIHVSGPAARVGPSAALALALALHELSTNAVKYGALSNGEGRVDIAWANGEGGRSLRLTWKERGGPPVVPPTRKGFGSRLLDGGLTADLGGRPSLVFAPGGVEASVPIALAD